MKMCAQCGAVKELTSFPRFAKSKGGRGAACKPCSRAQWIANNPDKMREYKRRWRSVNADRNRDAKRKNRYGLEYGQFDAMLIAQNGLCYTCNQPPTERGLFIDHDHVTGAVRKLLCAGCNAALGLAKDNPAILRQLAAYLEMHHVTT